MALNQNYEHLLRAKEREKAGTHMPFQTYSRTFFESDTRQLELVGGLKLLVCSAFILLLRYDALAVVPQVSRVMNRFGGEFVWAGIFFFAGLLQLWAIYWFYPKLRFVAALFSCMVWSAMTGVFLVNDLRLGLWIFTGMQAVDCAVVLVHRETAL